MSYKFSKPIFRFAFIIIILLFIVVLITEGNNPFKYDYYIECPLDGPACENPFYTGCSDNLCSPRSEIDPRINYNGELDNLKTLRAGFSYGKPPSFLIKNFICFAIIILISAFTFNHFKHNKNYGLLKKFKQAFKEAKL